MARRGSFRGRGISQSQRRKKTWVQIVELVSDTAKPGFTSAFAVDVIGGVLVGESSKAVVILASGDGTGGAPLVSVLPDESTILRARGSLVFPKNTASPGQLIKEEFSVGFGVTGLTDTDSNSYPGPLSDPSWDGWMFLRQSAVAPVDSIGTAVDVKAMRKIKSGDAFFISFEALNGDGSAPVGGNYIMDLRLLLLLP